MKRKVYSDPYMEIVLLNGEDIICASINDLNRSDADNDADVSFLNEGTGSQSLDYSDPVE